MQQPGISIQQPGVSMQQSGVSMQQHGVSIQQPGVSIQQPGVSIQQPGVSIQQPGPPWSQDNSACMVSAFMRYTNAIAEWTTLGLMALERCITIYNYRHSVGPSSWFTTRKTIAYCCTIWLLSLACQMPTLTGKFGKFSYNADYAKCDFTFNRTQYGVFSPRNMFFMLESMIPCILIMIGYVVILVQVHTSSSHVLSFLRSRSTQRSVSLRRSRTTRVIVKLLLVYLVCVIPVCVYNISLGDDVSQKKELGIVLYCIYWFQYCINNFVYVVSNERYRNAYWQFLCFMLCREIPWVPPPGARIKRKSQVFAISGMKYQEASSSKEQYSSGSKYQYDASSSTYQYSSGSKYQYDASGLMYQHVSGSEDQYERRISRFRTPSECEEAWRLASRGYYINHEEEEEDSSSVSSSSRPSHSKGLALRANLARSLSTSLKSSSSSSQGLVRSTCYLKKDIMGARNKLRRALSL
nr:neuropeptide CCHamide-1 receptor-like [Cherax quadricarinatus]